MKRWHFTLPIIAVASIYASFTQPAETVPDPAIQDNVEKAQMLIVQHKAMRLCDTIKAGEPFERWMDEQTQEIREGHDQDLVVRLASSAILRAAFVECPQYQETIMNLGDDRE